MLESVCYRKTRIAFSSFTSKRSYQGSWAADIAYGEGTGQCVPMWPGVALEHSGPSQATSRRQPAATCLGSSPE